ncbi:MAG: fimbrillin family protein, partial [Bacteroides sp.]
MNKMKLYVIVALAAMCASCSNNEDEMTQTPEKGTSIRVTASVQSAATRAGYSSDNLPQTFYL